MKPHQPWCLLLWGTVSTAALAQTPEVALPEVTVQSGRIEQRQFDAPGSVHALDAQVIRNGMQVNLSDALQQVPGVVALNRNNYAQDVQISIRGFGARAPFGLRGIRLITDGIPATTPDGQGQASTVSLTSTDRIEVLTGPLAQIYGNASGGVIQTFTREAPAQPEALSQIFVGSFGQTRTDWQLSGRSGQVGIVADYSTFGIDGYRDHSDTRRQQLNSVITLDSQPGTRWKLVVNMFDMPYAKDPLGLTQAQFAASPAQAGTYAVVKNARKTVSQNQLGLVFEHRLDRAISLTARIYGGTRDNLQFQTSVPPAPPTPVASTDGSWVGLNRRFDGLGAQLSGTSEFQGVGLAWVAGFDQDHAGEQRWGGPSFLGEKVRTPTRDEWNAASNQDYFAQANWFFSEHWTLTTGIRSSHVELRSQDNYLSDGNGSGAAKYSATSPVLGLTWHVTDQWNLYANQGKGFETPTLSETAYSTGSSGSSVVGTFNPLLRAATSRHQEVGTKWSPAATTRLSAAWFRIQTDNDIVPEFSAGGKTSYVNAARTLREGLELNIRHQWDRHWKSVGSLTSMRATYDQGFTSRSSTGAPITVPMGNQLPGIPQHQAFASLQWAQHGFGVSGKTPSTGLEASVDWLARSQLWANDVNTEAAPGFGLINARIKQRFTPAERVFMEAYLGIDNLTNRATIGSVIVNQSSGQFYEPGLPRAWVAGLQARLPL